MTSNKTLTLKFFYFIVGWLFTTCVFGQNCKITKQPFKTFYLEPKGKINEFYKMLKFKDSTSYQILLVNSYSLTDKVKCFYVSINRNKKIDAMVLEDEFVLFSDQVKFNIEKYSYNFISKYDSLNGVFFVGSCDNSVSAHNKQLLVICNNSLGLYMEYICIQGKMKETFPYNPQFMYLNNSFELIESIFKDLKFKID